MNRLLRTMVLAGVVFSSPGFASEFLKGVSDPQRAAYNWVMKCQGCHKADATGKGGTPNMVGTVAQFLHLKEGRAYLGRVPGVAFVDLPEKDVAELLNWMVQTFDKAHMPKEFEPYSVSEIKQLKQRPLISEALNARKELLQSVVDDS